MFTVAESHISAEAVAVILGAAATVATCVALFSRRGIDRRREKWRNEDRTQGWRDGRGIWHPGVNDRILGWDDNVGHHDGLPELVADLREAFDRHEADHTIHTGRRS